MPVVSDDLQRLRVEYGDSGFEPDDAGSDPFELFGQWFDEAREHGAVEPNAMALATATAQGVPSVRMVLLKGIDPVTGAFTWYTNFDSRKAAEVRATRHAALCWWWPGAPDRQVRAVGLVEEVDREVAGRYFDSRPRAARVGAAASPQSRAIASRRVLDDAIASIGAGDVALPDRWGGLRLVADELEFWQGRAGRLHDRVTFLRLDASDAVRSGPGSAAAGGGEALRERGSVVADRNGTRWLRARLAP